MTEVFIIDYGTCRHKQKILENFRNWSKFPEIEPLLLFFIVVQLQLYRLFPHCSPLPCLAPPSPESIPPIVPAHESSIHVPLLALSPLPRYPPTHSPLVTVTLFFISKSLSLLCSFFNIFVLLTLAGKRSRASNTIFHT